MQLNKRTTLIISIGLIPTLLIYTTFSIVPIGISFYYSFMSWNGFSDVEFIGLANYIELFQDKYFWNSLKNNLYVILASVVGQLGIALFIALLLNRKIKGAQIFRTIGFLPVVLSSVVVALTWSLIYNSETGLLNEVLRLIHLDGLTQNWLGDRKLAMLSVCITIIWQFIGLYLIIFLASLQNIPREILEAADIDGASEWQKTWSIIIPMMKETIFAALILAISGSLKTFDQILVMTGGGPAQSTEVAAIYMYNEAFDSLRYGYGNAVAIFIFIFGLLLIYIVNKLMGKRAI